MILITICLISCVCAIEGNQYPLLKVQVQTTQTTQYKELEALIQQKRFGKFINLELTKCPQNQRCQKFKVFDAFGTLLEQYQGESTVARYLGIIENHIDMNNYPISKATSSLELQDEELSLKIYEQRKKLLEENNSEDWEKADYNQDKNQKHGKKNTQKPKAKNNQPKGTQQKVLSHQQQIPKPASTENKETKNVPEDVPVKQQKIASRFQVTENILAWRLGYILMIIGLILGMKYLKQQQERIESQQKSNEETENLNNQ